MKLIYYIIGFDSKCKQIIHVRYSMNEAIIKMNELINEYGGEWHISLVLRKAILRNGEIIIR